MKNIGDKEFDFKAEPVTAGIVFSLILMAAIVLSLFVVFQSKGWDFSPWDALPLLAAMPMIIFVKLNHDKKARETNYFEYLGGFSKDELTEAVFSDAALNLASRNAIRKFLGV